MNLSWIKKSQIVRILGFLLVDDKRPSKIKSKLLTVSNRFASDRKTIIFFSLAIAFIWYKGMFNSFGLNFLATISSILSLLLALWFCDKNRIRLTRPMVYLMIFIVVLLLSALINNYLPAAMLLGGIFLYSQLGVAYLIGSAIKDKAAIIKALLILSCPLVVLGLYQGLIGPNTSKLWVSSTESLINRRAFAFFGSPNILGGVLMVLLLLSVISLINQHQKKTSQWFLIGYQTMGVAALLLTYSRSAWLGFGVGCLVIIVGHYIKWLKYAPLVLFSCLIPGVKQRLLTAFSSNYVIDSSLDGRRWSFNAAIEIFKRSPILGSGPGSYGGHTALYHNSPVYLQGMQNGYVAIFYTDNQWTQLLVQTGLIGLIIFCGFFLSVVVNSVADYVRTHNVYSLGAVAVVLAFLVFGGFSNALEFGAVAIPAGFAMSLGGDSA